MKFGDAPFTFQDVPFAVGGATRRADRSPRSPMQRPAARALVAAQSA